MSPAVALHLALALGAPPIDFALEIAPILAANCLRCHGAQKQRSGYRLDVRSIAFLGGEASAPNILPGDAASSSLIEFVSSSDPDTRMPPDGDGLSQAQIALLRRWVDEGAVWPESASVRVANPLDWWSLKPIVKPEIPVTAPNPIDAFLRARLTQDALTMAPQASDRTLYRRLSFDLTGLPPTPEELDAYAADTDPNKYEKLVDRLLASPRYGERFARHWLDVVHYADSHGYDKDKPREHAWPYRDYVIRALNVDKPFARFVQEQLAGDALFPNTRDGMEALGFIAAGPWDLISHEEVSEEKIDGKFARHFDRDDMVGNAIGTFASVTVQCAQCHDHKFDPVTQEDYYALQAVFAAIDRTERRFDLDATVASQRASLEGERARLQTERTALDAALTEAGGAEFAALEQEIAASTRVGPAPEFGFHSEITLNATTSTWVAVDLGHSRAFDRVVLAPCSDDFNGIGDGFGFPEAFTIEVADNAEFAHGVVEVAHGSSALLGTPRTTPVVLHTPNAMARFVRVTATHLAARRGDYIFALAELQVFDAAGRNIAAGAPVESLSSIEMPPRWRKSNLTDGVYPALKSTPTRAGELGAQRQALRKRLESDGTAARRTELEAELQRVAAAFDSLPAQSVVYAGAVHHGSGAFTGTGGNGGKPREIRVLARGQVTSPGAIAHAGALSALEAMLPSRFELAPDADESQRRVALAQWLTDPRNPLVWRSIVNRVWYYHFGRGLVDTPNDFGRMGATPTHPELLDWLAATFRDDLDGRLKSLHRLILTSAAYRQRSDTTNTAAESIDQSNTLLWRANPRKLEAEAVRDAVLATSGALDLTLGGSGYRDFVIEQPEHSPHYRYDLADPNDPATFRRSIYRFIVRSQMQPFMTTLDCADPSQRVDKRNQSVSPNQALAYLNNGFMLAQSQRFAQRVRQEVGEATDAQVDRAMRLALGRSASADERARLVGYTNQHGLENTCRVILNLNEFSFVD